MTNHQSAKEIHMMRMNLKFLVCTAVVFTALIAGPGVVYGQDATSQPVAQSTSDASTDQYIEMLRKDVRSLRKQIVAANLDLTDDEAVKILALYDPDTTDLRKINDTQVAPLNDYGPQYTTTNDEH